MKREYNYEEGEFRHITTKIFRIKKIALNFFKVGDVSVNKPKRCGITGRKIADEDMVALLFTDKRNVIALNEEAKKFTGSVESYNYQKVKED